MKKGLLNVGAVALSLVVGFFVGTIHGYGWKARANLHAGVCTPVRPGDLPTDETMSPSVPGDAVHEERFNQLWRGIQPGWPELPDITACGNRVRSGAMTYQIQCEGLFKEDPIPEPFFLASRGEVADSRVMNSFNSPLDRVSSPLERAKRMLLR
jgi:hypothetical protein